MPPQLTPNLQPLIDAGAAVLDAFKSVTEAFKAFGDVVKAVIDPLGIISDAFKDLAKTLATELKPVFDAIKTRIVEFAKSFRDGFDILWNMLPHALRDFVKNATSLVGGALADIAGKVGAFVAKAVGAANKVAGAVVEVAMALIQLGEQLAQLVKLADPATFMMFARAMEDLMASMGRIWAPVLTLVTQAIRTVADVMAGLAPVGQALATALKPLFTIFNIFAEVVGRQLLGMGRAVMVLAPALNVLGQIFVELTRAVQPVLDTLADIFTRGLVVAAELFADVMQSVGPYLIAAARLFADLMKAIVDGFRELLQSIGIDLPNELGYKPGSSVGMASRQASIGGMNDPQNKALVNAFSLGAGANTPADRTANAAEGLVGKADQIYQELKKLPESLAQQLATWAASVLRQAPYREAATFIGGGGVAGSMMAAAAPGPTS